MVTNARAQPLDTAYSRANPSPNYQELVALNRTLHTAGEATMGLSAEETFAGFSLLPYVHQIKLLIGYTGAETVLDYGSGKGRQYEHPLGDVGGGQVAGVVPDYWEVDELYCYDPGYPPYAELPAERFDGVVVTNVLEYCSEDDIPWILDEIFSYAEGFVFFAIACDPAKKTLPDGRNAHATVRPVEWWRERLEAVSQRYSAVLWEAYLLKITALDGVPRRVAERLSNFTIDAAEGQPPASTLEIGGEAAQEAT